MTDDNEPMERVGAKVPKRTKEIAKEKLEHGGLSRVVREAIAREAHGEEVAERDRVADHLKDLRKQKRDKIRKRDDINDDIEEIERQIERAEAELDRIDNSVGEYEGALQMIEDKMSQNGASVFIGHGQIRKAAEVGDRTQQDVIDDLKERNPDMAESRFTDGGSM